MGYLENPFFVAMLVKPLAVFVLFLLLAICVRLPIQRYMRDGKLKRFLLHKVN